MPIETDDSNNILCADGFPRFNSEPIDIDAFLAFCARMPIIAKPKAARGARVGRPLNLPGTSKAGHLSPDEVSEGHWREPLLRYVASLVSRGLSDEEIHVVVDGRFTLPGYAVADTARDVQGFIDTARRKGFDIGAAAEATSALATPAEPAAPVKLRAIRASSFLGLPKPREWIAEDWLPKGRLTSLYGPGGTGKSLLAQVLATCVAAGRPWLGVPVVKGRALLVMCEDEMDELERRQAAINAALGVSPAELSDLHLISRADDENTIFQYEPTRAAGPLYAPLRELVGDLKPSLLVLDSLADLFAGNENNRGQANHFAKAVIGGLLKLGGSTGLLLAHPSRAGEASGDLLSGSTAWSNAVRTRWTLDRPKDAPDGLILTRFKTNRASTGETIALEWRDGAIQLPRALDQVDRIAFAAAMRCVLRLVAKAWDDGAPYTKIGLRAIGKRLPKDASMDGIPPAVLARAIGEAEGDGLIRVRQSGGAGRYGFCLTETGQRMPKESV